MSTTKIFILVLLSILATSCKKEKFSLVAENAHLTKQSDAFKFTEGPASDKKGNVYFTDQPNNRIIIWDADKHCSTFMGNAGRSNGLYFLSETKLLACADEKNELWLINTETKEVEVIIDNVEGKKLNGPNDLWVNKLGGIYFTDPYYEREYWKEPQQRIKRQNVYYLSPDFSLIQIVDSLLIRPNGIIGTQDGKTLYIADIGDNKTYRYTIADNGQLTNRTLFCEMGSDGMTIDEQGNIYLTGDGVTIFNKKGKQILNIANNESWTANVTFGGKENKTLFITAMGSIYTLEMNVKGAH